MNTTIVANGVERECRSSNNCEYVLLLMNQSHTVWVQKERYIG
jgi:hypothetical protein